MFQPLTKICENWIERQTRKHSEDIANEYFAWMQYERDGGKLTYSEWIAQGKPEAIVWFGQLHHSCDYP